MVAHIEFNPAHHITAGQLRHLGFLLSEMIPDDAFIRRTAVGFHDKEKIADGRLRPRLRVLEQFRAAG